MAGIEVIADSPACVAARTQVRAASRNAQPAVTNNRRQTDARKIKQTVFVELDTRQNDGFTVSLEWNRDTGQTQIVIHDARSACHTVFGIPGAHAADAFRHPFRYAP